MLHFLTALKYKEKLNLLPRATLVKQAEATGALMEPSGPLTAPSLTSSRTSSANLPGFAASAPQPQASELWGSPGAPPPIPMSTKSQLHGRTLRPIFSFPRASQTGQPFAGSALPGAAAAAHASDAFALQPQAGELWESPGAPPRIPVSTKGQLHGPVLKPKFSFPKAHQIGQPQTGEPVLPHQVSKIGPPCRADQAGQPCVGFWKAALPQQENELEALASGHDGSTPQTSWGVA